MGSIISRLVGRKTAAAKVEGNAQYAVDGKRNCMFSDLNNENPRLIPSLPDEISTQILARLPRSCHLSMKLVSKSWKDAITSNEIVQMRKQLGKTEEWLYVLTKKDETLMWYAFDPQSGIWQRLPPMPHVECEKETSGSFLGHLTRSMMGTSYKIANVVRGWLGGKRTTDESPFSGSGFAAINGCLYVLGGFSKTSAMRCVLRYEPRSNSWSEVSPMIVGRAYCKTSVLNNKLYVVGGVTLGKGGLTPLQSAEVFDPSTGVWTEVAGMPFSKAQASPRALLSDTLKPMATGMSPYKGKLYVPQSLYSWPFFVDGGGEVYDPEKDAWEEMATGMGECWPARQAGTKFSVVVNGELYALDRSSSSEGAKIQTYDHQEDSWKVVAKVPIRDLTDSESPYLLAGFLGKLHVIAKDGESEVKVVQANLQMQLLCSSSKSDNSGKGDYMSATESDVWKAVAAKNFGPVELVNCQVLDM